MLAIEEFARGLTVNDRPVVWRKCDDLTSTATVDGVNLWWHPGSVEIHNAGSQAAAIYSPARPPNYFVLLWPDARLEYWPLVAEARDASTWRDRPPLL